MGELRTPLPEMTAYMLVRMCLWETELIHRTFLVLKGYQSLY